MHNGLKLIWVYRESCQEMTEAEALEYVFDGDTSKLYVTHVVWDGETEEEIERYKKKEMPCKYFFKKYDTGFLVGYTTYNNGESEENIYSCGHLCIYDKNYEKKSSLCVFILDEFEDYIQALFNPQTNKIYMCDITSKPISTMYKVNMETYQFEKIKEYKWAGDYVTFEEQLEYLKWDSDFVKE